MNTLIVYTPRSKSTYLTAVLSKKFNLVPMKWAILTLSRIANKNFSEYNKIIADINELENACVKVNGNDFIDLQCKSMVDYYRKIDYSRFDKIVFLTRSNFEDALLSYSYMNQSDRYSWHRKKGVAKNEHQYTVDLQKVLYLLRGYAAFEIIKDYIKSKVDQNIVYHYEFNTVDIQLLNDFGIAQLEVDTEANELDYKKLATNYDEVHDYVKFCLQRYENKPNLINDHQSVLWSPNAYCS